MVKVYGYKKCSTVRKATNFLNENNVEFTHVDNVENKLSADELKHFHELSGLDIKKFFNTSGMKYRELKLKDKLPEMTLTEKYELLATDGMLVKRPIIVNDNKVVVGFKVETVEAIL